MKILFRIASVLASASCMFAGIWLLQNAKFTSEDTLGTALGFYFIGKSFFIGPMLWATVNKSFNN